MGTGQMEAELGEAQSCPQGAEQPPMLQRSENYDKHKLGISIATWLGSGSNSNTSHQAGGSAVFP